MMAVAQVFMGAGMAVMYGFFYPEVDEVTALYIATGTPTLALIPLGLLMLPESVNQQRLEGTFDFIWSLPAPARPRPPPPSCSTRCCRCPAWCCPWWS
jgi:ABC-2 type transport system permease protein